MMALSKSSCSCKGSWCSSVFKLRSSLYLYDKDICDPGAQNSLKSLGYICSNSQKYIVWVKKIIHFSFMPKIISILSKDHVA